MKDVLEFVPFLQTYSAWVRWLALLWLLLTAAGIGVLLLAPRTTPPQPQLAIDDFRVAQDAVTGALTLDLLVRNPQPDTAQLVELQLAFYGASKPAGGLQSSTSESAAYYLVDGPDAEHVLVGNMDSTLRHQTRISYPYAGQDYAELRIPLSQTLKKDETDRLLVRFDTRQLPRTGHRNVEAVIRYNGDSLTPPRESPLGD